MTYTGIIQRYQKNRLWGRFFLQSALSAKKVSLAIAICPEPFFSKDCGRVPLPLQRRWRSDSETEISSRALSSSLSRRFSMKRTGRNKNQNSEQNDDPTEQNQEHGQCGDVSAEEGIGDVEALCDAVDSSDRKAFLHDVQVPPQEDISKEDRRIGSW